MGTYQFCVKAIFLEAAAFVACGFLVGLAYGTWKAIVAAQLLLLACEVAGYAIERWLNRRRGGENARW
jgi:diacylglycerol kinase